MKLGPRLVIAGTHSGVGKTTIATGLMSAFRQRGLSVRSAKVGPDFIDPGYHSVATGSFPRNLDPWICGSDAIAPLAGRASVGADILVVEGVMGLFDGAVDGTPSSSADVANLLDAPIILVVDAASMSSSVAALVAGYRDHDPTIKLAGVILNRVGSQHHATLLVEALDAIDVDVFGCVYRNENLVWRDRHLGLIPVQEQDPALVREIERLGRILTESCDLDRLLEIAVRSPPKPVSDPSVPDFVANVRIGLATGTAFTFSYQDNIEALQAAGAEVITFDPVNDEGLPSDLDGLVVGGGFPEVYAESLSTNKAMLGSVRDALASGLPTWAECGGLLWLCQELDGRPLVGSVPASGMMTKKLTLGYREATVQVRNPLGERGHVLRGHEFHYSKVKPAGDALELQSRFSTRLEGFAGPNVLATYLHLHLGGNHRPASHFVTSAGHYRTRQHLLAK